MATTRPIQLGDRTFAIATVTLGTLRRVPTAFQVAMATKDGFGDGLPSPDQFNAMIALVHDGVISATPEQASLTLEELTAIVDGLDMADGMRELAAAVSAMMKSVGAAAPSSDQGNARSSESATSPVSTD